MISILDANELAKAKRTSLSKGFDLKQATSLPIKLPQGWRFPYDVYIDTFRIRQTRLIVFVNSDGDVEVEWNDLDDLDSIRVEEVKKSVLEKIPLPKLEYALAEVHRKNPEAQIEDVETVLDISSKSETVFYWRIEILEGIDRCIVLVGDGHDGKLTYKCTGSRSKGVVNKWNMGLRFRRRSGRLTANLKGLSQDANYLVGQWTVWSCMSHITESIIKMGYGEVGTHNVHVEHIATSSLKPGAAFGRLRDIPTISFARGGGWAEDPSIVMHELGHALWDLLFTRPPHFIDQSQGTRLELAGIQEGFADYFAATLLVEDQASMQIGGNLPQKISKRYGLLPRLIDGNPVSIPSSPGDGNIPDEEFKYLVGRKWSNMLWDLRNQIGSDKADKIVFSAHFKPPRHKQNSSNTPFAAYYQSLMSTATDFGIEFNDWVSLSNCHAIPCV